MNNKIVSVIIISIIVIAGAMYLANQSNDVTIETPTPSSIVSASPGNSPTSSPRISKLPLPSNNGENKIGETVPWSRLLSDASCELKGEIKFINSNTYDNQDALFSYKGINSPASVVYWTVSPEEDISVGPNVFNKSPIPNGSSLIGVVMPQNPKFKKYELTAKITYNRQVDASGKFVVAGGTIKDYVKQCTGKTTIVLP